jgi:DNA-binding Lrp family transcriptional regulator
MALSSDPAVHHAVKPALQREPDHVEREMRHLKDHDTHRKLDSIDRHILSILQGNGRIANVDLARQVHLSPSPCLARVKALEREGFISRYVALLEPKAIGLGVEAFIQIRLEKQVQTAFGLFEKAVVLRPEVLQCCLIAGTADFLIRVIVPDLNAFQIFLTEYLSKIPGVANTQSSIVLREVKSVTELPVPPEES